MVVMVAAGGGRYSIEGVSGEGCRCDGRFRIWERWGEGRGEDGVVAMPEAKMCAYGKPDRAVGPVTNTR